MRFLFLEFNFYDTGLEGTFEGGALGIDVLGFVVKSATERFEFIFLIDE